MPRHGEPSNVEKQDELYTNSPLNFHDTSHLTPSLRISPDPSSNVIRAEQLAESPNPDTSVLVQGNDNWGSSQSPRNRSRKSPAPATFHPFSIHVLSLLMSSSVFGTLARLGIHALVSYDGQSIFPLAWVQAVGCGIMGFAVAMREPITLLYAALSDLSSSWTEACIAMVRYIPPLLLVNNYTVILCCVPLTPARLLWVVDDILWLATGCVSGLG
jgi:hypothetical protein